MKAIDFHKIYDNTGKELPFPKNQMPLHFYPDVGEIFDRIGAYIGDGKIIDNKLILTIQNNEKDTRTNSAREAGQNHGKGR